MKKAGYIRPEAETVLLREDDVIRASIIRMVEDIDAQGNPILPSVDWKN